VRCKDTAHVLVELLAVAKARLDHRKQLLPVILPEAERLGRIEALKLPLEQQLRLRLVRVRVRDHHDLDPLSTSTHAHEGEDLCSAPRGGTSAVLRA